MASPMKPMNVNSVVQERIGVDRGVDPDGQCDAPGEYDRRHGNDHGQGKTVADDVGHGAPPFHRHAEIALQDEAHPLGVLNRDGLVEAELLAQCLRLAFGNRATRRRHRGDVRGHVVARRQVDDHERQDRNGPDRQHGQHQATNDVSHHGNPMSSVRMSCRPERTLVQVVSQRRPRELGDADLRSFPNGRPPSSLLEVERDRHR